MDLPISNSASQVTSQCSSFPSVGTAIGALCLEMCVHPQGKSMFQIFSFIQNLLLLPAPPEQHLSGGQGQYGNLQMLGDANSWTCSEHHQCPRPVSLHPHQRQEEMKKIPGQAAVEQPPVRPGMWQFLYFLTAFFLGSITGELGYSNVLGQWMPEAMDELLTNMSFYQFSVVLPFKFIQCPFEWDTVVIV